MPWIDRLIASVLVLVGSACAPPGPEAREPDISTTAATATAPAGPTTSPVAAESPRPLVLVAIGDSFVAWSEWPETYARLAAAQLGAPVEVDLTLAGTGVPARSSWIEDRESARDSIRQADILVVQPQPGWVAAPLFTALLEGDCGGADNGDCLNEAASEYRQYLDDYLDLILDLTAPGTTVRVVLTGSWAIDGFYPGLRDESPESFATLAAALNTLMAQARGAATERGISVADVNAAFNGPGYQEPTPAGYLAADRIHLAPAGSEVVAILLHDLGYEPAE